MTLPKFALAEIDAEAEIKEAAERIATQRTVRAGLEAWKAADKAAGFETWKRVGAALSIGKQFALRSTGANRPEGAGYCREFGRWVKHHGFDGMPKSVRSNIVAFFENAADIECWHASLPEKERKRLRSAQRALHRWRSAMSPGATTYGRDPVAKAEAAWRQFATCMQSLSPDQAAPLWAIAHAQASKCATA